MGLQAGLVSVRYFQKSPGQVWSVSGLLAAVCNVPCEAASTHWFVDKASFEDFDRCAGNDKL